VAFLVFFIVWIPLYNWLASLTGYTGALGIPDLLLGLASALFWLVVFVVVAASVWWSKAAFATWTTADLMLTAVLGAVFGLLFVWWQVAYNAFSTLIGSANPWVGLTNGFWFVPAILVPYIIRKPGAALIGETLAGVLAVVFGSPWGVVGSAIAGLTQGMGAEVIFALTGWKRYDWLTLTLAGVGATITGFVYVWPIWFSQLSSDLLAITFIAILISVILFAVVGSKLLGDALLATGVLNRFAIGRARRQAQTTSEF
jgi:energy-coupling factor transport system substrate-specific component